ncbi:MAG: DegT/DnrJ/EryC1/StrS family aminotransferase, partial [Deltaproteobacteria bacterium]
DPARFPGTFAGLSRVLVLPWNERYQEAHIDFLADRIEAACATLREG